MRTDGSQQKISGSERGSEPDPLSRNNQVRKKQLYSFSKISVLFTMDKANGKTKNTQAVEYIFFCKRIPAMMSVRP